MRARLSAAHARSLWWLWMVVVAGCSDGVEREVSAAPQADAAQAMPAALHAAWIRATQADAAPRYDWSPEREASSSGVRWQVGARGLRAATGAWELALSMQAVGREGGALGEARVELEGNDARLVRPGVVERWVHGPLGVEHVIEVAERPAGTGALVVELAVEGLEPRLEGDAVTLSDEGGVRARYADLWVEDASGAAVPSRLEVSGGQIRIRVEDGGARYPLVLDPLLATQQAKLEASDGEEDDDFGLAVALDGDTAVVGAYGADIPAGVDGGFAYVFVRSGGAWIQQARLEPSVGEVVGLFGRSVALDGDTAVVGALAHDTSRGGEAGAAYVFVRSGTAWTQQARLEASDGEPSAEFGTSVAIDGDTAVVGAGYANTHGYDSGAAYVFVRSGTAWTEQAKLDATEGDTDDHFGFSVAVDGDTAVVGAPDEDTTRGSDTGAAYVFVRSGSTWTRQAKLEGDGAASELVAWSVALDGDTAVVGAPHSTTTRGGYTAGVAYAFVRSGTTWTLQAVLEATDASAGDELGWSVALDGDTAVVGARWDDPSLAVNAGSAYVFVRSGTAWTQQAKLEVSDGGAADELGSAVAVSGETTVVGARRAHDSSDIRTGAAYVFALQRTDGDPCSTDGECASGFCTDGVCCASACAGGASDCQACSVAAGGTTDGTCTALSAAAAPTVTCRTSAGGCDVPETCDAASTACPADSFAGAGTECRASAGACDLPETCTGTGAECPDDSFASAGAECRASAGPCDLPETCTGAGAECPADSFASADTECRAAAGACDVAESCTGSAADCPADSFASADTECRAATGACDAAETCTGSAADCPADSFASAGTECRAGSCASGVETLPASCDGIGATCPVEETRDCGSYACASDSCATSCTSDADCASGSFCTAGACGPVADASIPDRDAGVADAALADGGVVAVEGSGCGCRAASGRTRAPWLLGLVALAALRRRARRR